MEKINCDIIQDLIPSYVDNICSNATKQCVEEHIADCQECRKQVELYQQNALSGESLEKKQLDGLKRIRQSIKIQNIISYCLLLLLVVFDLYTFKTGAPGISRAFYYILFPIFLAGMYLLTMHQHQWNPVTMKDWILFIASIMASIYGIFIIGHCINTLIDDKIPFGLEMQQIGPFVVRNWKYVLAIQIVIFAYYLYRLLRKNIACHCQICINLTGIFLILISERLLRGLDEPEQFRLEYLRSTAFVYLIGILGIVFYQIIFHRQKGL